MTTTTPTDRHQHNGPAVTAVDSWRRPARAHAREETGHSGPGMKGQQ